MCIEERAPASLMRYLFPLKRCDQKPQIYTLVKKNKEYFHQSKNKKLTVTTTIKQSVKGSHQRNWNEISI